MATGVLRTPRAVVPPVNLQAGKLGGIGSVTKHDEVAAILKGLKLNKEWFMARIQQDALKELQPAQPLIEGMSKAHRENLRKNRKRATLMKEQLPSRTQDFDIYINEAVMPILAQALDALCRQLSRMQEQGDHLDPKVRARFNPLTWLGQQLLRRHPKCARTPRRQQLFKGFADWADWEKGRREVLRKQAVCSEVFKGFLKRGVVQRNMVTAVTAAFDDTLMLEGALKTNENIQKAMQAAKDEGERRKGAGDSITFEEYWYYLGSAIMKHDIVPQSLLLQGKAKRANQLREQQEFQQQQQEMEEARQREEEEKRRLTAEYTVLYEQLKQDDMILAILNEGRILTGDDVRPGDIGFELEVPPFGKHVRLLAGVFGLLGFDETKEEEENKEESGSAVYAKGQGFFRASAKASFVEGAQEEEQFWTEPLANSWAVVQKAHGADMLDGVVDGGILQQVLVEPEGFYAVKARVEPVLKRRREGKDDEDNEYDIDTGVRAEEKPTFEQLCTRLGMTMSRLEWLHELFESFLQPDPDADEDAEPPCCLYPECPASLNKEQMRALVAEVEPGLSKAQFEARFKRLDSDGSGLIEFDEFAIWVHSSDVRVTSNHMAFKMTFEEIACRYQEPLDLILYLHSCFQDQLPDGVVDEYPAEPVGLAKQEAVFLASIITPNFDAAEFSASCALVDQGSRQPGYYDFDEFVEMLELDDLPAELRDRFDAN